MSDYDVIVVGAGNAGLTAAATLQRGGARTLLLERHNIPGGCATSFCRGRFEFEVALHQLSGIGREESRAVIYGLLDSLGIADKLEFVEEHEMYRTVVRDLLDVTLPASWDGAADAIEAAFPGNGGRAEQFFNLLREVRRWWWVAARGAPGDAEVVEQLQGPGRVLLDYGLRSTKEVLDEHFDDQRVKYVLGSYWSYIGQPPSAIPFMDLAMVLFAYFETKPFHVRGGSQMLSSALLDSFLAAGGDARFNTPVQRFLTRGGAVSGVRLDDGEEVTADAVVANVSPVLTYGRMLDPEVVPPDVIRDLRSRRVGPSAFVLHMGLDATAEELGLTESSTFIATDLDEDRLAAAGRSLEPSPWALATCYDVAPIGFSPPGGCHVALMNLQYADHWRRLPPGDYARAKFDYAETLLDLMEIIAPSIRERIEEIDVATPLTMEHYLAHPGGAIYGFDKDATDSWLFRNSERVHVPGLYHAGSWANRGGFTPTLDAGARTARRILAGGGVAR